MAVRMERLSRIVLVLPSKLRTIRGFFVPSFWDKTWDKTLFSLAKKWLKTWCISIGRKEPRDRILLPPSARCEPDFLDEVDKAVVDYPGLRVQPHASWAGAGWL